MCGITGLLSQQPVQPHRLKDAVASLHHRGPDDFGIWGDRHVQLGHTRLAILDLSPLGHQPMSYQNERFWITFNGEIYNYLELRQELIDLGYSFNSRSDTEVLLAAYAEWNVDCLSRLRGMFAFGIWDSQTHRLFIARDRTDEKPLYYWTDQQSFYFASELKTLLKLLPTQPELDPGAIDLFLHYQYVPEPHTPLQGVMKLAAAHYLIIDLQNWNVSPQRYWSLQQVEPIAGDITERLRHELDQTLSLTLRSDVPVGIALSGGLDSGGIAALAAPKYQDVLQAFSVGYPGRPACDERHEAKALADRLGLPFHDVELRTDDLVNLFPTLITAMDDPIADIAAYGHFAVMQLAASHGVKVMLSGIGGDELFWGYDWVMDAVRLTQQKQVALSGARHVLSGVDLEPLTCSPLYSRLSHSRWIPKAGRSLLHQVQSWSQLALTQPQQSVFYNTRGDFQSAWFCRNQLYTSSFLSQLEPRHPFEPFALMPQDKADVPMQITQLLFDTWLVSNCLSLGDRTSMAASLEVRIPLLDHRLIELVIGLQKQYPDRSTAHKRWLKDTLKNVLPDEILNRQKRGFEPPYGEWIAALVKRYGETVLEGHLIKSGYFNRAVVEKMFKEFKKNYAVVYRLIVLEIWCQSVFLGALN
jgi:asparagine synthase (glutamine-hydrolysing)